MAPSQEKLSVKWEKRQEWLARFENGESPPKIAATDGVDARTVRKHIGIARQEKETKEARGIVLRNALERHYADLCQYAEGLTMRSLPRYSIGLDSEAGLSVKYKDYLGDALRQHLPKSPIWSLLNQETKLKANKTTLMDTLNQRIESAILSNPDIVAKFSIEENGVIPGLIEALKSQSEWCAGGSQGLDPVNDLKQEPAENGFVYLSYGSFKLGKVIKENVEFVSETLIYWTAEIKGWEEYSGLEKTLRDLKSVETKLRDEIAVIVLRRVLPGRCRYCPI